MKNRSTKKRGSDFLLFGRLSNSGMNFCEYLSSTVAIVFRISKCLCRQELKINHDLDVYLNSRDLSAWFLPSLSQSSCKEWELEGLFWSLVTIWVGMSVCARGSVYYLTMGCRTARGAGYSCWSPSPADRHGLYWFQPLTLSSISFKPWDYLSGCTWYLNN